MHFKRDRYVGGNQNKHGKKACPDNFRPIEKEIIRVLLNDLNTIYFSNVSIASTENLLDNNLKKLNSKPVNNHEKIQKQLASLRTKKQKALDLLLDNKINQKDYDGLVATLNPEIEKLVEQLNLLQYEESNLQVDVANLKAYILNQLNPKQPLTELTLSILSRFIHKITVKADGLEVHYRTSKLSAFYISTNIKLDIPKTHPNKEYVEKHA